MAPPDRTILVDDAGAEIRATQTDEIMLDSSVLSNPRATMTTGKKVASDAAKTLRNPKASKKEKELAGSDLAQAKHKPKSTAKGKNRRSKRLSLDSTACRGGGSAFVFSRSTFPRDAKLHSK